MIVVICDSIPPAVRGRMKLFFLEVKPGVFVSGVKDAVAKEISDYLYSNSEFDSTFILIESTNTAPYYKIRKKGSGSFDILTINGLPLKKD